MARQCGVNVKEYVARRNYPQVRKELERAKELTLLALRFEQEEQVSAWGTITVTESAGGIDSSPVSPAANPIPLSPPNPSQAADTAGDVAYPASSAAPIPMQSPLAEQDSTVGLAPSEQGEALNRADADTDITMKHSNIAGQSA
jgi:hypothetical protein